MEGFLKRCAREKERRGTSFVLYLEGGIASGKTTILTLMGQRGGGKVATFPEPVSEWTHYQFAEGGGFYNPLSKFYEEKNAAAAGPGKGKCSSACLESFRLQLIILLSLAKREEQIRQCATDPRGPPLLVVERSISSTLAFVRANKKCFCPIELSLILDLHDLLLRTVPPTRIVPLHRTIYLKATVPTQKTRAELRSRKEEEKIDVSYLALVAHQTEREALSRPRSHSLNTDQLSPFQVEERVWEIISK